MGVIPDLNKPIYEEEIRYRAAVSEGTWYKIGGLLNWIRNRIYLTKQFQVNGPYSIKPFPHDFEDGITIFEFDAEIFNVYAYNLVPGISGTTEFDILVKPKIGGAWTSIFTTRPQIQAAAGTAWVGVGDTVPFTTHGVLTSPKVNVNAGDAVKLMLIQGQSGARSCGAEIHYRSR